MQCSYGNILKDGVTESLHILSLICDMLLVASDAYGADTAASHRPRIAGHEMLPLVSHRDAFRVIP
jgi:hypothetical protein